MITAVIPVYNHERYLADAIHSCLLCSEISEILIADDGSTDKSRDVISFFAGKFPGLIRDLTDSPPRNIGAHNRINSLCREAKNEWIAVLNSDDRFQAGRFRNLREFVRYTGADLVFGNCSIIGPENELLGYKYALYSPEYALPRELEVGAIVEKQQWLLALLNQNFVATTSNMVFTVELFEELGGFRPYRYIHDWDFMLRAAAENTVAYNPNMWTDYRIHPSNTISESSYRVRAEVKSMMASLLEKTEIIDRLTHSYTADLSSIALAGNRYLQERVALSFVFPDPYHPDAAFLSRQFTDCPVLGTVDEAISRSQYVYAPSSTDGLLSKNEILNLLVSAANGDFDFSVCNLGAPDEDRFAGSLMDVSIWRPTVLKEFRHGEDLSGRIGKIIAIPRSTASKTFSLSVALSSKTASLKDGRIAFDGASAEDRIAFSLMELSQKQLVQPNDDRPVVFVFPAVVAVGGAENVLIEIMKQLKSNYRFVLICTEKLTAAQGSSVGRALDHAEAYYDLTHLGSAADFMNILAWLKAAYEPRLVFVTNGSTWQAENSWQLRKLFRDVAIIDHQVYDSKYGWVKWLEYPSARNSDRFVAVTKKIETHFLASLDLPPELVDFIPHPINSEGILRNLPLYERGDSLKKFGLDPDKAVVAFVGRMVPQKRPFLYLDLAERAKNDQLPVQFVMAGQGELANFVEQRIESGNLDNLIRISNVDPLEELYATTDLLVITSEYEGVPLAMLEAMSAGVPVFSTDAGDIALVLEKYHGHSVEPVDAATDDLYAAFKKAILDLPALKQTAKAAAMDILQDFSGETIARRYQASFERAMSKYATTRAY